MICVWCHTPGPGWVGSWLAPAWHQSTTYHVLKIFKQASATPKSSTWSPWPIATLLQAPSSTVG